MNIETEPKITWNDVAIASFAISDFEENEEFSGEGVLIRELACEILGGEVTSFGRLDPAVEAISGYICALVVRNEFNRRAA